MPQSPFQDAISPAAGDGDLLENLGGTMVTQLTARRRLSRGPSCGQCAARMSRPIADSGPSQLRILNRTKSQRGASLPPFAVIMQWPVGPKKRPTSTVRERAVEGNRLSEVCADPEPVPAAWALASSPCLLLRVVAAGSGH